MSDREPEQRRIEIVHESLLTKWPRLVRWQTQDAEGVQLRDELRQAANLWRQHDRSEDFLWTGMAYREYQLWRERYSGNLTENEEAFAESMTAHAQRRRRTRRIALVAAFAVLFLLLGLITLSWRSTALARRRAEAEARQAKASKLRALAQVQLDSYPTAALAYATKSLEIADSEEARRFAVRALWRGPTTFILPVPEDTTYTLSFSPDSKWLATSSVEGSVLLFSSSGGLPMALPRQENTSWRRQVVLEPKGDLLVTRGYKDPVSIWSFPETKLLRQIAQDPACFVVRAGQLWMFDLKPGTTSGMLRRWSLPDGPGVDVARVNVGSAELVKWSALIPFANFLAFDIDETGTWLAVARDRTVSLHSLRNFERKEQPVGIHSDNVVAEQFDSNGKLLSSDASGEIRVWSLQDKTPRLLRVIRGSKSDRWTTFDQSGARVAAANPNDRVISIWNVADIPESDALELRRGDSSRYEGLAFGRRHVPWLAAINEKSISFWPLTREYPRVFRGHTNDVTGVGFDPNGRWVASASLDGTVRIWPLDGRANSESRVIFKENLYIYVLAVDPSGKRVLAGATNSKMLLLGSEGNEVPRVFHFVGAPGAAVFDRRGRVAAIAAHYVPKGQKMMIRFWDVETSEVFKELDLAERGQGVQRTGPWDDGVDSMKFAPDGSLYTAGEGGVRRWDIERGTSRTVVRGGWMRMDLSDDGRYLVTVTNPTKSSANSLVRYYDLSRTTSVTLTSHGSDVTSVALDPTGTIVVTGSSDGTIRVGRATGEEPHLLFGHQGPVRSVAVSRDGRFIASGGQDGTVRVWPMADLSKPPLQTLPLAKLIAKLESLTNLRVIEDESSPNGYKLNIGPFAGWNTSPKW